ncbi:MAG: DUF4270 domain-containing protein [Bacteroidetes bacterium]|nr:DUF4270 domain-containing protein [Bacteroidota bacterium]
MGLDVQPAGELIDLQTEDTVTVETYTVREDSLRTDESPIVQIGSYNDPDFGRVSAGLFTQFSVPNSLTNLDFGSTAVLDSTILQLKYDYDFYGDTTTAMHFSVYQMTEDIYKDSEYYSNHSKQFYPTIVGDTLFTPHPRTYVPTSSDTLPPYLSFHINSSFAQQIFGQSGGPNLASNAAFLDYFKGFYIAPDSTLPGGSMLRFNLLDSLTRFTFYYHTSTDTLRFSFVVNTGSAYYSYFNHNYNGAASSLLTQLASPGPNTDNEVYIQACAGVKTKILFPYLNNLRSLGYPIAINKAELVIKADPSQSTADLPVNKQLYAVYLDSAGHQFLMTDMFENSVYYGGSVNTTTSEYHINMARYFQQLMNGTLPNYGLYLKEVSPVEYSRRAVIGSGRNDPTNTYKMYLHLVYTRIN